MIKEALHEVINNRHLEYDTAKQVMQEIMSGEASHAQMAAYLTALRMKGETIEEITASAQVMREMAAHLDTPYDVLEIVGTGGDEAGTFNISTTSAFVIAAAGIPVAKHGNRSVSSKSGAADVLECLGADIMVDVEQERRILDETKMCFLFAQSHHASMKNVGPVRKDMGERTMFNILGPLTNPANSSFQLLGVYDVSLVEKLAKVLSNLGVTRGFAVCGSDGLDEITLTGPTHCCEIREGTFRSYDITPEQFGMKRCAPEELVGGTPEENAKITRDILSGRETGPKRDIIVLNAGAAIYLGKLGITLEDGVEEAARILASGKAFEKLEEFVAATNRSRMERIGGTAV